MVFCGGVLIELFLIGRLRNEFEDCSVSSLSIFSDFTILAVRSFPSVCGLCSGLVLLSPWVELLVDHEMRN